MDYKVGDKIMCKRDYHNPEFSHKNDLVEIFDDITIPLFKENEFYTVTNVDTEKLIYYDNLSEEEAKNYIEVNKEFVKREYFYTEKELRKKKLEQIAKRNCK